MTGLSKVGSFKSWVYSRVQYKATITEVTVPQNIPPMSRAHMLEGSEALTTSIRERITEVDPKILALLDQPIPPMSGEKFDYLGCYDLDYNVDRKGLWNTVKHFVDHTAYFFLGKRQYGRNYPDNNMAAAQQSGQDAFWGFQNVVNSLINGVSSWGSNVFHRLSSYTDSAIYLEQRNYHATYSRGLSGLSKHEWYKDILTPLRFINGLLSIIKGRTSRSGIPFIRFLGEVAAPIAFLPVKLVLFPLNVLWVMTATVLRNRFHAMGLAKADRLKDGPVLNAFRKTLNLVPLICKAANERPYTETIALQAAQDFTTETEDMASCKWSMRVKRWITNMRVSSFNPLILLYTALLEFIVVGQPHERGGFIEGIGGQGSHANDKRAFGATECTRWRRGNLAVDEEVKYTPMKRISKMRYRDLARYWLINIFRVSFVLSPVLFSFLGFVPLIIKTTVPLIGITINAPIFGALVAFNMFFNMGAYFYAMRARGYTTREAARCMLKDYFQFFFSITGSIQGYFTKVKEGFVKSPKKGDAPIRASFSELKWEYAFAGLNLGAMVYAALFAQAAGTLTMLLGGVWGLWNGLFLLGAIFYLNKGAREKKATFLDWRIGRIEAKLRPYNNEKKNGENKDKNKAPAPKDSYYDPQITRLELLFSSLSEQEVNAIQSQIDEMKTKISRPNLLITAAERVLNHRAGARDLTRDNIKGLDKAFMNIELADKESVLGNELEAIWVILKDKNSQLSSGQLKKVREEIEKIKERKAAVQAGRFDAKIDALVKKLNELNNKRKTRQEKMRKRIGLRGGWLRGKGDQMILSLLDNPSEEGGVKQ